MARKLPSNVLVVDDEPDSCHNLADILNDLGYGVDCAHDAQSALALVREKPYDVVLLDLKMPDMDGLTLHREIRGIRPFTEAFLVTAYSGGLAVEEALAAGISAIVSKPINVPRLLDVVRQALDKPPVLIVDDDRDLCENLWGILKERGYLVRVAHDEAEAFERLRTASFAVVLIDLRIPGGDGAAVFRRVVETSPKSRTVFMTGYPAETEHLLEIVPAAADRILRKPLNVDRLLDRIDRLVEAREDANQP